MCLGYSLGRENGPGWYGQLEARGRRMDVVNSNVRVGRLPGPVVATPNIGFFGRDGGDAPAAKLEACVHVRFPMGFEANEGALAWHIPHLGSVLNEKGHTENALCDIERTDRET